MPDKLSVDDVFELRMKNHWMITGSSDRRIPGTFVLTTKYDSTTKEGKVSEKRIFLGQILLAVITLFHDDILKQL